MQCHGERFSAYPQGYFSLNDFYAWAACNGHYYHHGNCGPSLTGKNDVGVFDLHAKDASECQKSLSEKWPSQKATRSLFLI